MRISALFFFAILVAMRVAAGEEPLPTAAVLASLADRSELIVVGTLTDYCRGGGGRGACRKWKPGDSNSQTYSAEDLGALSIESVVKGSKPAPEPVHIVINTKFTVTISPEKNTMTIDYPPTPASQAYVMNHGIGTSHLFFLHRMKVNGTYSMTTTEKSGNEVTEAIVWETADEACPLYPNNPKLIDALKKFLGQPDSRLK